VTRTRGRLSAPLRRLILLLACFFVLDHFVLPKLAGLRESLHLLADVNLAFLALGVGLQLASVLAYTKLTSSVLPRHGAPTLFTLLRVQLSTLAVSHVVPGGTAAGGALGYRLLTQTGLSGTDTAFALATQSMGSAVVLNALLLLALLVSIPLRGYNPAYTVAAILGILAIGGFSLAVVLLIRGETRAIRILRAVAGRLPMVSEERVESIVRRIAGRLKALAADRELVGNAIWWATANWLLDAASLWVFVGAFGHWVHLDGLIVAYGLANVLAVIPITPSGLGVVEAVLIPSLVGFGTPAPVATVGVLVYRLVNFWLPIPLGGVAYLSFRVDKELVERRGEELRQLAERSLQEAEDRRSWAERHGLRIGQRGEDDGDPTG
jgi:putative heme transporter